MHSAPAVSYPVGRSHFQAAVVAALTGLTALVLLVWRAESDVADHRHGLAALLWLFCSVWMAWQWWRTPPATLAWDGRGWSWSDAVTNRVVQPEVVLDFQGGLLLRLRDLVDGQVIWAWPDRRSQGPRWAAFRRALYSPRPAEANR